MSPQVSNTSTFVPLFIYVGRPMYVCMYVLVSKRNIAYKSYKMKWLKIKKCRKFCVRGRDIENVYRLKIIMCIECPNKTWRPVCVCVCVCVCVLCCQCIWPFTQGPDHRGLLLKLP